MKRFLKNSLIALAMIIPIFSLSSIALATPTYAADPVDYTADPACTGYTGSNFLGLVSWNCGVVEPKNESELKQNIYQIITNISKNIVIIATYLVIGYVIYGGYLYMFAAGDVSKVAGGKKTLMHAFIGLAIIGLSNIIISSIHMALLGNTEDFSNEIPNINANAADIVMNLINWFIGIAGIVSAIFLVVGGVGYMTSSGDSGKLQKAKNTITYSLIGLAIVGLSYAISNFAIFMINGASGDGNIETALTTLLNNIIIVLGLVAVVFIIIGGVGYMTSAGDAGKAQKAKSTILYACIGLLVCALAFGIVNFAIKAIEGNSSPSGGDTDPDDPDITLVLENPIAFLEKKL